MGLELWTGRFRLTGETNSGTVAAWRWVEHARLLDKNLRSPCTLNTYHAHTFRSLSGDRDSEGEDEDDVYDTATPAKNDFRCCGVSLRSPVRPERVARWARSSKASFARKHRVLIICNELRFDEVYEYYSRTHHDSQHITTRTSFIRSRQAAVHLSSLASSVRDFFTTVGTVFMGNFIIEFVPNFV